MKAGSEAAFQQQLVQLAGCYGWDLVYHTHDSRRSQPGFPDLVLARPPEILFVEVKTQTGRVRPEQSRWIQALTECGLDARIIRPADFDDFHARVARGRHQLTPLYRDVA